MKYLLDTHIFIWLDNEPDRLSSKVASICADPAHTLWLSLVSVWEMQIKLQLGKLTLPMPLAATIQNHINTNQIGVMPIQLSHILSLDSLPSYHKDPFDRLLIAQAIAENAVLLTDDTQIKKYPVSTFW